MTLPRMPEEPIKGWTYLPSGTDSITISFKAKTLDADLLRWLAGFRTTPLHRFLFACALLYAFALGTLDWLRRRA